METIGGVDIFIAAVILLSAILSFARGFTEEMLGIGAWLVAGTIGFYSMPLLSPYVSNYISKPLLANLAIFFSVGLILLIILTLLFHKIGKKVKESSLNRLDHFLGFLFGLIRGVLILVLIYFIIMTLSPKTLSDYQKESKLFPYLERITENAKKQLPEALFDTPTKRDDTPDNIDELIEKLNQAPDKKGKKAKQAPKKEERKERAAAEKPAEKREKPVNPERSLFDDLNDPAVKSKNAGKTGYDKREREELDKLFLETSDDAEEPMDWD